MGHLAHTCMQILPFLQYMYSKRGSRILFSEGVHEHVDDQSL